MSPRKLHDFRNLDDGPWATCVKSNEGCEARVKNHKWGKVKAEGWFFTRDLPDDKGYCPDHHPEWVAAWRAKKKQARPKDGSIQLVAECIACNGEITKPVGEGTWVHENSGEIDCEGTGNGNQVDR